MKRRRFFQTSLASTAAMLGQKAWGEVYLPPREETTRISILHTTDLHGHLLPTRTYEGVEDVGGFGRCLTQIRKWRRSNPNHLTLDLGDLYQGTHASLQSEGELMIKCLNAANFDGWVAGNHEFDWGERVFRNAVEKSEMPVLSANLEADGFKAGHKHHESGAYQNLQASLVKEIDGIRIGVIGLTTPGLPFWLNSGQLGSVKALDPVEQARASIDELKAQDVHCIIAAGHMGLKRYDVDDYANQVNRLIRACPEIDVYLSGHTHRDRESTLIGNTLFTQAGYHGIWAGRVNLIFSKEGSLLLRRDAETVLMDSTVDIDPTVHRLGSDALEDSKEALQQEVGELADELSESSFDEEGADSQSLIAAGIVYALRKRDTEVDGVLHGAFSRDPIPKGRKFLQDMWEIVPYENRIVTATLTGEQLIALLEEAFTNGFGRRRLVGFELEVEYDRELKKQRVLEAKAPDGSPVDPAKSYRIAFNSYDAQSGGRSMLLLRELLLKPSSKTQYFSVDTREALTDLFLDEGVVTAALIEELTGA